MKHNLKLYQFIALTVSESKDMPDNNGKIIYKYPMGNNKMPLVLPDAVTEEEQLAPIQATEERVSLDDFKEWKMSMPKDNERLIENYFLEDVEVKKKEVVFESLHQKYLDDLHKRQADKRNSEANGEELNEEDAAQVEGHARYVKASSRRKGRNSNASAR